ncbi:hypothetical protein LJC42_07825 [Eubacteriales bacterium OttesenSCG-928-K08]|nr:hypothetical protein [Eubacteriales bacterium OttesenSCG-928-K08]
MISHWLGWFSLGFCVVLALKFIARKSKASSLNLFFRRIHIPIGVMLLIIGTLHGLITIAKFPDRTVPIITGIATVMLIFFIAATYMFRKRLKKKWLPFHRIGTVLSLLSIFIHLLFSLM